MKNQFKRNPRTKALWENQDTMHSMETVHVPAITTEKIPVMENMDVFCAWMNGMIKNGFCIISFEHVHCNYIAKRIYKYNDDFFQVVYDDYHGMEHKAIVLDSTDFKINFRWIRL